MIIDTTTKVAQSLPQISSLVMIFVNNNQACRIVDTLTEFPCHARAVVTNVTNDKIKKFGRRKIQKGPTCRGQVFTKPLNMHAMNPHTFPHYITTTISLVQLYQVCGPCWWYQYGQRVVSSTPRLTLIPTSCGFKSIRQKLKKAYGSRYY